MQFLPKTSIAYNLILKIFIFVMVSRHVKLQCFFLKKSHVCTKLHVYHLHTRWGNPPLWLCYSGVFQKLSFTVPVSAVFEYFQGIFLNFQTSHFQCRSLLVSKTYICMSFYKKKIAQIADVPLTARGRGSRT